MKTENFARGSKVLQALVANSTDVAVGFYDHTIQMQAKGRTWWPSCCSRATPAW